jgi:hypothetical protein
MKSKTKHSESTSRSVEKRNTDAPKQRSTGAPAQRRPVPDNPSFDDSIIPASRYSLKKGLGFWQLTFQGVNAIFKHEQGALYVTYLLLNPPEEPIHALDLLTRIAALDRKEAGLPEIEDPVTGATLPLESHARLQERSLALDDAQLMRATLRSQNQLETILEDSQIIEPVRREVERELEALYRYEENNCLRTIDAAQKAVRTVRMAINRFCDHLAEATDIQGSPHAVLRLFAKHLRDHLLVPSARFPGGRTRASSGIAGCFTYEPPAAVTWVEE